MNAFEKLLIIPGAAVIMADKLSGRIISRVADGFDEDPALEDMMHLYRAIENEYSGDIMSLKAMYDLQLTDAATDTAASTEALEGLTPEQREIWENEPSSELSRIQRLQKALPKIVDLYAIAIEADPARWDDLTPINQWSLLNAVERGLHKRKKRYERWAQEDEDKGREDTKAIRLLQEAESAIKPLFDLISEFLDDPGIKDALSNDRDQGIRVPTRVKVA